jgi:hypothetical protein
MLFILTHYEMPLNLLHVPEVVLRHFLDGLPRA